MKARIAVAVLATALLAAAPPPAKTVTVTLPANDPAGFKPGAGAELVARDCLTCHSAAYVNIQPVLTRAQWQAEVVKMRGPYGGASVIPEADIPALVDYLTAQYGKP